MKTYYAPSFIDQSRTYPNKNGKSKSTGILSGMIMTRRFVKTPKGNWKGIRGIVPFSWSPDTEEAKAKSLKKAIKDMQEMAELDSNPPIDWIPDILLK